MRSIQEVIMPFKVEKPALLFNDSTDNGFNFNSIAILFNKTQSIFL